MTGKYVLYCSAMGLDQEMYARGGQENGRVRIGEWRKNYALDRWMMRLYKTAGGTGTGYFVPIHLTVADLECLRNDMCTGSLVNESVTGSRTLRSDLGILHEALRLIDRGYRVFYRSG